MYGGVDIVNVVLPDGNEGKARSKQFLVELS